MLSMTNQKPSTVQIRKFSNKKALKELNFYPLNSFDYGLRKTINWYLKQKKNEKKN